MWLFQLGSIHLVHATNEPTRGGSPLLPSTTPIAVGQGWTPNTAKPIAYFAGGPPLQNGSQLLYMAYEVVDETIPITIDGTDADNAAQILSDLQVELSSATYSAPCVWKHRPTYATNTVYADVYSASVQPKVSDDTISPVEGWAQIEAEITLKRSPFFGAQQLMTLLSAVTITNNGDVRSLGTLFGDMRREGQPLNIRLNKPTSQVAASVILATIHSYSKVQIDESKTTASTTTGTNYTLSSAIDISALRTRKALSLRLLARLTTLTAPTKAQLKITVQTTAGNALWESEWVRLGSNATAQLVDLGDTTLDAVRIPLASTVSIKLLATLRSTDGTSVTATIDYLEALLAYDCCIVEGATLASGQRLLLFGAQNLSGGGYQPMIPEGAQVLDASDVSVSTPRIRGQLVRAFEGASLYVAWRDSGNAHTDTDTAALTVDHAPLWRTLRGLI